MRDYLPLLIAACLLAVLAAGAATALPADATSIDDEPETNDSDAGICLVGADSPCNGDGVDDTAANGSGEDGEMGVCVVGAESPCNGDGVDNSGANGSGEDGEMGVCVVGAGGPCNGDGVDETAHGNSTDESTDGAHIGHSPGEDHRSADGPDVGICVVGAGGPCNDAGADESERIGTGAVDDRSDSAIGPIWTQQQSGNPFAGLVSLLWSLLVPA